MRRHLILLSFIEGISLLVLLFVAMPVKYLMAEPGLVRSVGMAHGVLFLALIGLIGVVAKQERWKGSLVIFALVCSSVPFGMFALEKRLRNQPVV